MTARLPASTRSGRPSLSAVRSRAYPWLMPKLPRSTAILLIVGSSALAAAPGLYRLDFPSLHLSSESGERVSRLDVEVTCGRFRGISNIPDDWSVEVVSPSSEQTSLHAEAGHGSAWLWNLQPLDGAIRVEVKDRDCFTISAKVRAETGSSDRTISFSAKQLRLVP